MDFINLSEAFTLKLMDSVFGKRYDVSFVRSLIEWLINSKYRKYKRLDKFISEQVNYPTDTVKSLAESFTGDYDKRIIDILKFVRGYVTYTSDTKQYGYAEHWGYADQTLKSRKGDCDNMNSLIHVLGLLSGIPSYLLYSVIGDVDGGGHYWLVYISPNTGKLYSIDSTYWYDSRDIPNRSELEPNLYFNMWYIFNNKYIWRVK